ncbi:MAG: cytochrome ubiquinol oxidase subunit I [Bacteroidales bacterium]|nr:cytochrome ubiquinol oxidase subunit I [Bacteroidales bacterium]
MNYPIWQIPATGGSILIATIAILHVFIAHLAVGGGLYLVLTEHKAVRNNDNRLLQYVKSHTRFFLLLTMVFGGVSGVGIWFIISLVNPAATSTLIHNFVFAWATEWVFFVGEIIALLIYHYRFDSMNRKAHMTVGWLYFAFAWLSLFIINGIIDFMLTPGEWLTTNEFVHGFFNPSFLPSLIFRTGIAFTLAGLFGMITAVLTKDLDFRAQLLRYNVKWMYAPIVLLLIGGILYLNVLPAPAEQNLFMYNPEANTFDSVFFISSILLFALGLTMLLKFNRKAQSVIVGLLIVIGLGWIGGFEYLREIARKPYVIYEYMYSNSIKVNEAEKINKEGYLKNAKWAPIHEVNDENLLEAGEVIFAHQCLSCHTVGGYNDIIPRTDHLTERGMEAKLTGLGRIETYMPHFFGTDKERKAVAAYITRKINGKKEQPGKKHIAEAEVPEIPPFDKEQDEYVLLAWNDLGMHCISDNSRWFSFLPPANTIWAQLIKRGEKPQVISSGVELKYEVQEGYRNPEKHVPFWKYAEKVYGAKLEPGVGLSGNKVTGTMHPNVHNSFIAEFIPVTPYRDDGKFNPYPAFTITAYNKETGEKLAMTKAIAPTSTEMGCRNCHQGGWRWNDVAGIADETSINILQVHDRLSNTNLYEQAKNGNPVLCQSCHGDPAIGAGGKKEHLNFSSAMHGFHANYLSGMSGDACNLCHPNTPGGTTECLRSRHAEKGFNCTLCHGKMEDHAMALLKHEDERGKPSAERLMQNLPLRGVESVKQVNPRMPWLQETDCLSCHVNFDVMSSGRGIDGFNRWVAGGSELYRNRTDTHGVMCAACHGSPHAVYMATNMYGKERDNMQPIQYMGISGTIGTNKNCDVCHTIDMKFNGHHRNMIKKNYKYRVPVLKENKGQQVLKDKEAGNETAKMNNTNTSQSNALAFIPALVGILFFMFRKFKVR